MRVSLIVVALLLFGCAGRASQIEDGAEARIRGDMAFLAADARMGREPGTEGYDAAADYVVLRMRAAGLKASDAGWRQNVPMRSSRRDLDAARFILSSSGQRTELLHLEDYLVGRSFDGAKFGVSAPLAYAGYGVVAPDEGVDDYEGLDVAGKIVILFSGAPPSMNTEKRAFYSDSDRKEAIAAAHGAVGVVFMQTKVDAARRKWSDIAARAATLGMTSLDPDGRPHLPAPSIKASAYLNRAGAAKLFAGERAEFAELEAKESEGKGAPKGFALSKTATISGASILGDLGSDNLIGVIEGSDPALKDEVVLLTAHLDHIGVSPSAKAGEDAINNGALDNAGGVAVLLEAARALAEPGERPLRTIAFAAVTAEEKGLIGSEYLARHPAFGRKRVVANVNLDMPVALYPFTDVIAFGAERSSIGPVVAAAAESMGLALTPDPTPEQNIFIRSDHYSFVKEGVPSIFLVTGFASGGDAAFKKFLKERYHRPADDLSQPIDYEALARFADLNVRIARALAAAPSAPTWNEDDFFGRTFSK